MSTKYVCNFKLSEHYRTPEKLKILIVSELSVADKSDSPSAVVHSGTVSRRRRPKSDSGAAMNPNQTLLRLGEVWCRLYA